MIDRDQKHNDRYQPKRFGAHKVFAGQFTCDKKHYFTSILHGQLLFKQFGYVFGQGFGTF